MLDEKEEVADAMSSDLMKLHWHLLDKSGGKVDWSKKYSDLMSRIGIGPKNDKGEWK